MQNIIINAAKLKKNDFVKQFLIEHKDRTRHLVKEAENNFYDIR